MCLSLSWTVCTFRKSQKLYCLHFLPCSPQHEFLSHSHQVTMFQRSAISPARWERQGVMRPSGSFPKLGHCWKKLVLYIKWESVCKTSKPGNSYLCSPTDSNLGLSFMHRYTQVLMLVSNGDERKCLVLCFLVYARQMQVEMISFTLENLAYCLNWGSEVQGQSLATCDLASENKDFSSVPGCMIVILVISFHTKVALLRQKLWGGNSLCPGWLLQSSVETCSNHMLTL